MMATASQTTHATTMDAARSIHIMDGTMHPPATGRLPRPRRAEGARMEGQARLPRLRNGRFWPDDCQRPGRGLNVRVPQAGQG